MKRNHMLIAAAAFFMLLAVSFAIHPAVGSGVTLATVAGVAVIGKREDLSDIKMKVNDKGEVVFENADEFQAFADSLAEAGAQKLAKLLKINEAPAPPGFTSPDDPKQLSVAPKDETRSAKMIRIDKAIVEVSGGRLAVESAPREIKLNRWLQAIYDGNREVQKALGSGSWPEARLKALTEGSAADGGNLVPVEFDSALHVAMEEYGICEQDALIVPMTTKEKDLRTVTTKPTVTRAGELVASTEGAPKFGKPQLTCDVYTAHQIISREEMDDNNVGLFDRLVDLYAEQLAYVKDYEGLVATYYPGVLGDFANTTKTTMESASILDVKYNELVKMSRSLSPGQLARGGKFYMNRTTLGVIESLADDHGRPIVNNTFSPLGPTLLGYPLKLSEAMPGIASDAANTPFVIFGNLQWLAFGKRAGITTQVLREATLAKTGGGTVNLAEQRAIALMIDDRWGFRLTIPSNLATLVTKA